MKTLADLPIDLSLKSTKAKSTVPVAVLERPENPNTVAEYVELKDQIDALKAKCDLLERELKREGFAYVARTNIENVAAGREPISSVKFQDPLPEGVKSAGQQDAVMVSVVNDYLKFDQAVVEAALATMRVGAKKADPNAYLRWQVVAEFNTDVFFTEGKFDVEKHALFAEAIQDAAVKAGVDNPLSLGKVMKVQDTFHLRRWKDFDLEANVRLAEVLPCKLTPKVVRPKAG